MDCVDLSTDYSSTVSVLIGNFSELFACIADIFYSAVSDDMAVHSAIETFLYFSDSIQSRLMVLLVTCSAFNFTFLSLQLCDCFSVVDRYVVD